MKCPCIFSKTYVSAIAFAVVSVQPNASKVANFHLISLLFGTWVVFAYRDFYPFATFTLKPLDLSEGWLMYTKLGVLSIAAVVIPLAIPNQYIPLDPKVCSTYLNFRFVNIVFLGSCCRTKSRADCVLVLLALVLFLGLDHPASLSNHSFATCRVPAGCGLRSGEKSDQGQLSSEQVHIPVTLALTVRSTWIPHHPRQRSTWFGVS